MTEQSTNPIELSQLFTSPTQCISSRDTMEFLFGRLKIEVSGACGPHREAPYECYYPVHQAYPNPTRHVTTPGGQKATVQDKDIIATWRLPNIPAACEVYSWEMIFERALGNGTAYVAIEEFIDGHPGICMFWII